MFHSELQKHRKTKIQSFNLIGLLISQTMVLNKDNKCLLKSIHTAASSLIQPPCHTEHYGSPCPAQPLPCTASALLQPTNRRQMMQIYRSCIIIVLLWTLGSITLYSCSIFLSYFCCCGKSTNNFFKKCSSIFVRFIKIRETIKYHKT